VRLSRVPYFRQAYCGPLHCFIKDKQTEKFQSTSGTVGNLNFNFMNVYTSRATISGFTMALKFEICTVTHTADRASLMDNSYISPPHVIRTHCCVTFKNVFLPGAVPSVYFLQLTQYPPLCLLSSPRDLHLYTPQTCSSIRASHLAVIKCHNRQYAIRLLRTVLPFWKCPMRQQLFVVVS
jgi:hypothetical protein